MHGNLRGSIAGTVGPISARWPDVGGKDVAREDGVAWVVYGYVDDLVWAVDEGCVGDASPVVAIGVVDEQLGSEFIEVDTAVE